MIDNVTANPEAIAIFQHVRVVLGIILGLSVTRLLTGVARFMQYPGHNKAYAVHLGWVLSMLLTLVHFWWWEFRLSEIPRWTFEIYIFLITYTILLFLLCTLLFPDMIENYVDYEEFFISRRKWFFSIFGLTILFDVVDSFIKGSAHYALFETEYLFRIPIYLALCAVAIKTPDRRFHKFFVTANLVYQVSWIARLFNTLS